MADRNDQSFETFQDLSRAFWEQWVETGLKAFESGSEVASKAWGEAAEAWHSWLPDHAMPGPGHVMESLARQGRAFLELGQSVAGARGNGGWSEWLDGWTDFATGANAVNAGAFGLPGEALEGLSPPGGALDPSALLSMPALGYFREHQSAQQELARAHVAYQQANARYNALIEKALREAANRFRDKLAAAEEPGQQITSLRALYDLWVDAAEEAYEEIAFTQEFRSAYGSLVNELMRLRQAWTRVTEPVLQACGVPTRGELDAATRQIHELRREIASLKQPEARSGDEASPGGRRRAPARKKKATARKSSDKG